YIDITFNTGVYGDSHHMNPVNREDFTLINETNGGNATIVDLADVRKPDAAEIEQASFLTGGEKTVRVFLYIPKLATGEETIEIKARGDSTIFSYSGLCMHETETTGIINLNHIPRITKTEMAIDNTYVDVHFSTGIHGSPDGLSPIEKGDFNLSLNLDTEGCGLTQAEIVSVKKPDNTSEGSATPLTGGETVVRFFLALSGNETKNDNIIIGPRDGSSLYDQRGTAMQIDKTTGVIYFNQRELNMLSAELAEDNSYIDVYFSTGVYGDTNGKTTVNLNNFYLSGDSTIVQFSSIKKPDSTNENEASPLKGGETAVRFFLKILQHPGDDKVHILASKYDHPIYNSWGSIIKNASTDDLTLHDMRIKIVSAEMESYNRYLDIIFNKGIYNSDGSPVTADNFFITLAAGGTLEKIKIISLKKPDSKIEADATPLEGGENSVRMFLELQGSPSGEETFSIRVSHVEDETGVLAHYAIVVEDIHVLPPTPEIVSSEFVTEPGLYVDITFNTPVFYYVLDTWGPLTKAAFKINAINLMGSSSHMEIIGVRNPDGATPEEASPLVGGAKKVRVFLKQTGLSNGDDKFQISPYDSRFIVSSDKKTILTLGTQFFHPEPNLPVFTGIYSPGGMNYLDISFNYGVYSYDWSWDGPIQKECFAISFKDPDKSLQVIRKSFRKPNHEIELEASPLVGGEKTIRAFFEVTGEYTGDETISFQYFNEHPVYSYIQGEMRYMLLYQSSGEFKIPAPGLKIEHVSKVIPVDSFGQYVDVSFSGEVYGDSQKLSSVHSDAFILELKNNEGEVTTIKPRYILTVNDENLTGGEKFVRIYFNNTDENNVTMTIRAEENSIFNITGIPMKATEAVSDIRLAKVHPRLTDASMGTGSKYIDIYFDRPVRSIDQDALSLDDFEFVFNQNDGNVKNPKFYHISDTDGEEWHEASRPSIYSTAFRIFMEYDGTPTGAETVEIKGKQGTITDSKGNVVPIDISTDPVHFVTPYLSTMEDSYTEGWMNGLVSRSSEHTLVVDTNGDVTAFGSNVYGECDVPEDLEHVKTVAAGDYFSVALKKNGQLSGWGRIKVPENVWGVKNISHSKYGVFALRYDGTIAFIGNHEFRFDPETQE
ncbi:MAG TPA: hypothetical protein PK733_10650, partial [Clostridiales bacterium]|nr:hypothetical protein [Clostridiales bacterium]